MSVTVRNQEIHKTYVHADVNSSSRNCFRKFT